MLFQSLAEKMTQAFKSFKNKGKLTEADVKAGMREVKLALLEADVNFKVVKDFVAKVSERAVGSEVLESLLPAQQISPLQGAIFRSLIEFRFIHMHYITTADENRQPARKI